MTGYNSECIRVLIHDKPKKWLKRSNSQRATKTALGSAPEEGALLGTSRLGPSFLLLFHNLVVLIRTFGLLGIVAHATEI